MSTQRSHNSALLTLQLCLISKILVVITSKQQELKRMLLTSWEEKKQDCWRAKQYCSSEIWLWMLSVKADVYVGENEH